MAKPPFVQRPNKGKPLAKSLLFQHKWRGEKEKSLTLTGITKAARRKTLKNPTEVGKE